MKKWSKEEDALLKKHYPSSTLEEFKALFPDRSEDSIVRRSDRLHLHKNSIWRKKHYQKTLANSSFKNKEAEEMKKSLEKYAGKDKIKGRQIRLNVKRLKVKDGKDYAEVLFFGDVHWGARECDKEKVRAMLDYCLEHKIYIFLMGDLIEAGLKSSVGASMYRQEINPQKQMEEVIELLKPLAEAGLIIGALEGNHERRIEKDTGISIMKVICNLLNIPYLGSACWNLFRVGNQSYTVYTLHGASSARYTYTKLKSVIDISHSFDADLIAQGHVHALADTAQLVQYIDKQSRTVKERKKYILLTGSYLKYDRSYAQEKGLPPTKTGSPKVKFFSNRWDIHIIY